MPNAASPLRRAKTATPLPSHQPADQPQTGSERTDDAQATPQDREWALPMVRIDGGAFNGDTNDATLHKAVGPQYTVTSNVTVPGTRHDIGIP
jgi:hypothetical protein